MEHSSSQHPHPPLSSTSFEVSFIPQDEDNSDIVDDLYGPGRTLGKFFDVAGRQIDRALSRAAERLGYGPRVTADRIRRRLHLIEHSNMRYEGLSFCWRCCCSVEEFLPSLALVKAETEKLLKDIKVLLNYMDSNVPLTQVQAVNHILDLSFDHYDVRTLFKQTGAVKIIENLLQAHSKIRHDDGYFDNLLLSSSRKALVSLRDAEINTLLQEWRCTPFGLGMPSANEERAISLWKKISASLYDPEIAFLVMRTLARSAPMWLYAATVPRQVIRDVTSCMANGANYFEWEECEYISFNIYDAFSLFGAQSIAPDYLRFAGNIPESRPFRLMSKRVEELEEFDFRRVHVLKAAIMRFVADDDDDDERRSTDVPEYLQAFRGAFDCPLERAVCEFAWNNPHFSSWCDLSLYTEISHYIESTDVKLRAKAWEYANCFLALDLKQCDLMLEALSRTAFVATVDFPAFRRTKRAKTIPRKAYWDTVYRHVDEAGRTCLLSTWPRNALIKPDGGSCSCDITETEQLEYPSEWISEILVKRGIAVSTLGCFPLIAGHDKSGACSYVAQLSSFVSCIGCHESFNSVNFAVTEGTKPEDLYIEICCTHQKQLRSIEFIVVQVLRYPPDEYLNYPEAFGSGGEGVDATGPFSWEPAKGRKIRRSPYTVRVLSVDEAIENGWDLDDEELSPWNGYTTHSEPTSDCPAFCEEVINRDSCPELDHSRSYEEEDEDATGSMSPTSRSAMSVDDERLAIDAESANQDFHEDAVVVLANGNGVSDEDTSDEEDLTSGDQVDIQSGIEQDGPLEVYLVPHMVGVITDDASDGDTSSGNKRESDISSYNEAGLSEMEAKSIELGLSMDDEKAETEMDLVNTSDKSSVDEHIVDVAHKGRHEASATYTYIGATDLRQAVIIVLSMVLGILLTRMYDSMQVW